MSTGFITTFNTPDKFSKENNFAQVIFGADSPLLEVELNEMQKIQYYARNISIKNILSNGFINTPELYISSGTLTVPADIIVADGEVLEILGNMTLSGLVRDDKVYLRIFSTTVTKDTSLKKSGNISGGEAISNTLMDTRVYAETTRRVQKQVQLTKTKPGTIPAGEVYLDVATINSTSTFTDTRNVVALKGRKAEVNDLVLGGKYKLNVNQSLNSLDFNLI